MTVISHRGLNAYNQIFPESSLEAFENYLQKGFPVEFDVYFHNNEILITHDLPSCHSALPSIALAKGGRATIESQPLPLQSVFNLIKKYKIKNNALHLKGKFQEKKNLDLLITEINKNLDLLNYFFIFDVKIDTAKYLKYQIPNIKLAPSIAHQYDIERYGKSVNNTLLSIDEVIKNKELFTWVWLDEWDRKDVDNKQKILYTKELFKILRENNLKIALVSPELHATSPGLLGGEVHEDAKARDTLFARIKEIAALKPDLICTDYIRI